MKTEVNIGHETKLFDWLMGTEPLRQTRLISDFETKGEAFTINGRKYIEKSTHLRDQQEEQIQLILENDLL